MDMMRLRKLSHVNEKEEEKEERKMKEWRQRDL